MYTAITDAEMIEGTPVDFYLNTKDKSPTMKTTINGSDCDNRGRIFISVEGLEEWFPFYHFAKTTSIQRYGCEITDPLDDLQMRLGI